MSAKIETFLGDETAAPGKVLSVLGIVCPMSGGTQEKQERWREISVPAEWMSLREISVHLSSAWCGFDGLQS